MNHSNKQDIPFIFNQNILQICEFLDVSYITDILQTHKITNKTLFKYYKQQQANKQKWIKTYFCDEIIDLIGDMNTFINIPILPSKKEFIGSTGYIDGIRPKHICNHMMCGIDSYKRAFIVLSTNIQNHPEVLFQRYSDCKNTWSNSGNYIVCEGGHFMTDGIMKHRLLHVNICNLVNNMGFIYNYYNYTNKLVITKNIYLSL